MNLAKQISSAGIIAVYTILCHVVVTLKVCSVFWNQIKHIFLLKQFTDTICLCFFSRQFKSDSFSISFVFLICFAITVNLKNAIAILLILSSHLLTSVVFLFFCLFSLELSFHVFRLNFNHIFFVFGFETNFFKDVKVVKA